MSHPIPSFDPKDRRHTEDSKFSPIKKPSAKKEPVDEYKSAMRAFRKVVKNKMQHAIKIRGFAPKSKSEDLDSHREH